MKMCSCAIIGQCCHQVMLLILNILAFPDRINLMVSHYTFLNGPFGINKPVCMRSEMENGTVGDKKKY